jgi:hypothetical protein
VAIKVSERWLQKCCADKIIQLIRLSMAHFHSNCLVKVLSIFDFLCENEGGQLMISVRQVKLWES